MENPSSNNRFTTKDISLAAWLYSQGFELLETQTESFPSIFIFDNHNPKLTEHVRDFQCGRAEGNILTFYNAYKMLIRKVKVARI